MPPRTAKPRPRRAPEGLPPRRLVLCLDGTANNPFTERKSLNGEKIVKPTNVLKLARALPPYDSVTGYEQVSYYDIGVGALGFYPGVTNWFLGASDKLFGGLGAGFEGNVEDALHFLALNHREGDEVFLFGFSRGAATARAVARFLEWSSGLPTKNDAYYLPRLFRAFVESHGTASFHDVVGEINLHRRLKNRPPLEPIRPVPIRFLGVWDTVMALGSRFEAVGDRTSSPSKSFYMSPAPPSSVRHARQALAIDEVRFDFRPEIWHYAHKGQTLRQRWFAGVHSNVGGSYAHDGLANIALHWMLQEAAAEGLRVDSNFVRHYRPYHLDLLYRSDRWYYRLFDGIRRRLGRGKRSLVGIPSTANLVLDPTVIRRMQWDSKRTEPGQKVRMDRTYRPPNVIRLLAQQDDLEGFLASMSGATGGFPRTSSGKSTTFGRSRARSRWRRFRTGRFRSDA